MTDKEIRSVQNRLYYMQNRERILKKAKENYKKKNVDTTAVPTNSI
jgi:hypothetical protein